MGLAERKVKQRIGADPRNTAWIDDSSKFGEKYLQSLGWSSGQGLGLAGDGRKDNIKIHQKLDLLGIGANRRGPEADDWRAGWEYDKLLSRLNQVEGSPTNPQPHSLSGFHKASVSEASPDEGRTIKKKRKRSEEVEKKQEKELKKKKKSKDEEREEGKEKKKKKEKKEKKDAKKVSKEDSSSAPTQSNIPEIEKVPTIKGPLYRAHRKKHLNAKRLAAVSSQGMREILGISSMGEDGTPNLFTATAESFVAVDATGNSVEGHATLHSETNTLRKSEKSMTDYFAEKLRLKKQKS